MKKFNTVEYLQRMEELIEYQGFVSTTILPSIETNNGLEIAIQAGELFCCSPRDNYGPWELVEINYINRRIEKLTAYADDAENIEDTIYRWVPVDLIDEIVEENGGIKK